MTDWTKSNPNPNPKSTDKPSTSKVEDPKGDAPALIKQGKTTEYIAKFDLEPNSSVDADHNLKLDSEENKETVNKLLDRESSDTTSNKPLAWLSSESYANSKTGKLKFRYNRDTVLDAEILSEGSNGEGWLNLKTSVGEFGNVRYEASGKTDGTYFFTSPELEEKLDREIQGNKVDPNRSS